MWRPLGKKRIGLLYSADLRARVVSACSRGNKTEFEVAEEYKVGEATVRRWKRLLRETGALAPLPHGGGNPAKIHGEGLVFVPDLTRAQPDATGDELRVALAETAAVHASNAAVGRGWGSPEKSR